jgi:hypothetical protein
MFQVNTENLVKSKLYICKEYHIQPSEISILPYYEYEIILEEIKVIQKEQEGERERQEKQQADMQRNMNPSSMMNSARNSMPSMGNISMPKVNIPKF